MMNREYRTSPAVSSTRRSEDRLIALIRSTVGERGRARVGIGDDACVLKGGMVITTDAYEQGVHFDLAYMTLRQIGERCACAALSDVVAMGAEPEAVLVALTLPRALTDPQVRSLYRGIDRVCARLGCEVVGGDIVVSRRLALTITATGRTRRPRLRSAARAGDRVYVTGQLGSAEAGRLALKHGFDRRQFPRTTRRHLLPLPRIEVARRLGPHIHALIDTSDGLGTDARHIADASRVKLVLDPAALPRLPETERLCDRLGIDLTRFLLESGEDYELLFTAGHRIPARVEDTPIACIGRAEPGAGIWIEHAGKSRRLRVRGFDHFM
jgi:thiamine-monophosphate kinase